MIINPHGKRLVFDSFGYYFKLKVHVLKLSRTIEFFALNCSFSISCVPEYSQFIFTVLNNIKAPIL